MPTATGRETTFEREQRQKAEDYAAKRTLFTDEIRDTARGDVLAYIAGTYDRKAIESMYPAGERHTVKAGRRTITLDEGSVRQLALADAFKEEGFAVIAHTLRFDLFGGRHTMVYGVVLGQA